MWGFIQILEGDFINIRGPVRNVINDDFPK